MTARQASIHVRQLHGDPPCASPGRCWYRPRRFGDHRGFFLETYSAARLRRARHPGCLRAGQPLALGRAGHDPRPAFPAAAACPGQAGARAARRHPRRRGRYPAVLADLSAACRGRADRRERASSSSCRPASPMASARSSPDTEVAYKVTDPMRRTATAASPGTIPTSALALAGRRRRGAVCPTRTGRAPRLRGPAEPPSTEACGVPCASWSPAAPASSARPLVPPSRAASAATTVLSRRQADLCRQPARSRRSRRTAALSPSSRPTSATRAAVRAALAEFRPDAVMHLAAESHVDRSIDGPAPSSQTNVVGTFSLLEAARGYWRRCRRGRRRPSASTMSRPTRCSARSARTALSPRTTPYDPRSPYSASKAASDHLARAWHDTYGLPVVVTNCSNNYGPSISPRS